MIKSIKIAPFRGNKDVLLPKWKNCIGLLYPLTMKSLQLKIGSLLLMKTLNGQVLLKSWPYDLLEESVIALPGVSLFKHYDTSNSSIEHYTHYTFPVDRIVLCPIEYKKFMHTKAFKAFLLDYLDCIYVKEGMILHVTYLGYPCCFTIKKVYSNVCESDTQLPNELNSDLSISFNFSNVNSNLDDSSILEKSFNEKCNISKPFKQESRFQSSTPISSPKILTQTKSCLQNIEYPDLQAFESASVSETFYRMNKKAKTFIIPTIECAQKQKLGMRFEDIGCLDEQMNYIKSSIDSLLYDGEDTKSKGVFVIGPPGTGKSMITKAIQTEYEQELPVYTVNKNLFRSEGNNIAQLKNVFNDAKENSPCILILDNIDQLGESDKFQNKSKNEKTTTHQISSMIHNLLISVPDVLVIATSQTESSVYANLRKHVALLKELRIAIPSSVERKEIFIKILRKFDNILTPQEVLEISEMAHGFTGSDLRRLCDKATGIASQRSDSDQMIISYLDLKKSLDFIKPSSMAELGFEVPNVRWSDIGGMDEVINAVKEMVDWPLKYPDQFKKLNITPSRGILMYGPPGCCKTMIAKALAAESQLNFIYIKDSKVFSMYVGDSEKSVSEVFKKARAAAPCVLFFDEVESLAPKRGSSSGNSNVADRVITQILIEIDGIDVLQEGVCVIAATNQPHRIDPSLLRPGRLDRLIYVPLPDAATRKEIFEVILSKKSLSPDVDVSYLVDKTEGYTGAEITDICSQACMHVIKEDITSTTSVLNMNHLLTSLASTKPRTTPEMIEIFENYRNSKLFNL